MKNRHYIHKYIEEIHKEVVDKNIIEFNKCMNITISEVFEKVAADNSDTLALEYQDKHYTYRELVAIVNKIAANLYRLGAVPGDVIGIYLDKSDLYVSTILAILKCGCTYLPLNKIYPVDRINRILSVSEAVYIVTDQSVDIFQIKTITIDLLLSPLDETEIVVSKKSQKAYILFTSGTTGTPKGITICNSNVLNLIDSMQDEIYKVANAEESLRIALMADMVFDVSVGQMYLALLTGNTLIIIPDEVKRSVAKITAFFREKKIDVSDLTPTLLSLIVSYTEVSPRDGMLPQTVIAGGEALPLWLVHKVYEYQAYKDLEIYNYYGPTETCVYVTCFYINRILAKSLNSMKIGIPIKNTQIYILNDNLQPCDIGEEGEICISGACVGLGYINNQEATAKAFRKDIKGIDSCVYRTGDLGRLGIDGLLECFGRNDSQIKLRGFRIELEEIEAQINQIPGIVANKVVVKKDSNDMLVDYFISVEGIKFEMILMYLSKILPEYMIPFHFVPVERFETTINGKFDMSKLPDYKTHALKGDVKVRIIDSSQDNEYSQLVLDICRELLGNDQLELTDSFLQNGGNSLLMYILAIRISSLLHINIDISSIYNCNTINDISEIVVQHKDNIQLPEYISNEYPTRDIPVTAFQNMILMLEAGANKLRDERKEHNYPTYNIIYEWSIEKFFDAVKLTAALNRMVAQHEVLRTTIKNDNGKYSMTLHEQGMNGFEIIRCTNIAEIKCIDYARDFILDQLPLFQFTLFEDNKGNQKIMLNIHHAIIDYISLQIFISELLQIYNGRTVTPYYNSYFEHLFRKDNSGKEKAYRFWNNYYRGRRRAVNIQGVKGEICKVRPTDEFRVYQHKVNSDLIPLLRERCLELEITEYIFLFSALAILFMYYSRSDDLIIGTYVPGRGGDDQQIDVLGCLINIIGIRFIIDETCVIDDYLVRQSMNYEKTIKYQNVSYFEILKCLEKEDLMKGELLLSIFNYVYFQTIELTQACGKLSTREIGLEPEFQPLNVKVYSTNDEIRIDIKYDTRIHTSDFIINFHNDYMYIIEYMVNHPRVKIKELLEQLDLFNEDLNNRLVRI